MQHSLKTLSKLELAVSQLVDRLTLRSMNVSFTNSVRFCTSKQALEVKDKKSDLYRNLYSKIKANGPISIAEYMKECLVNPIAGYYTTKEDVFGQRGDFITSPEITQLFGEMIAIWIINEWRKLSKSPFQLVELGPGKGTLAKDILRVFKKLKFPNVASIHFVEISPILAEIQAKNLLVSVENAIPEDVGNQEVPNKCYKKGITPDGTKVYWYNSIRDVPKNFSIFLAHEFFDALPIHKFQRTENGWYEVLIDIDEKTDQQKFRYVLSSAPTLASQVYIPNNERRDHIEISPQSMVTVEYLSSFLTEYGGFSLIIDYGHSGDKTDTFRAFHQHKQQDPLLNPGAADLTADVDFSLLKKIAEKDNKVITFGPLDQRTFLENLGIHVRLQMILKTATPEQRRHVVSGYHMIMDKDKMGERFKVFSLFPYVLKEYLGKWRVAGFHDKTS